MTHQIIEGYLIDKGAILEDLRQYNYLILLDTLKEQLTKENNGIVSDSVNRCSMITVEEISLHSISVGNFDHLEIVEPREPVSPTGSTKIIGVIVRKASRDKLIDGYHRYKYALMHGITKGFFIVIS